MNDFPAPYFYVDHYKVHSYETDFKQRLSLSALLNFMQETAGNHATANGFGFSQLSGKGHFWVLSRAKVNIQRYPTWNDELKLRTWSKTPDSLMAHRDFELLDAQDNIVAAANTVWLIVDVNSRRPVRMDGTFAQFPHVNDRTAIAAAAKLNPINATLQAPHTIALGEMDMNGHVNNGCYVRWALDSLPLDFAQQNEVCDLEINFLHESCAGQQYAVGMQQVSDSTFMGNIVRQNDGKELIRIQIQTRTCP
jgi:acyl-ACP thioesterase